MFKKSKLVQEKAQEVVGVHVGQSSGSLLSMARQPTLAPLPIKIFGGLFVANRGAGWLGRHLVTI